PPARRNRDVQLSAPFWSAWRPVLPENAPLFHAAPRSSTKRPVCPENALFFIATPFWSARRCHPYFSPAILILVRRKPMAASTLTSKGQVTIPKEVRDRLGLTEGDRLEFVFDEQG